MVHVPERHKFVFFNVVLILMYFASQIYTHVHHVSKYMCIFKKKKKRKKMNFEFQRLHGAWPPFGIFVDISNFFNNSVKLEEA